MQSCLVRLLTQCVRFLRWLRQWARRRSPVERWGHRTASTVSRLVFAQPKPKWVRHEVIRLKALIPEAGCRMLAHHFNRRWRQRKHMTVSKTYVADLCRKQQYLIYEARRKRKHRIPD